MCIRDRGYDPSELFDVREFQNGDRLQSVHWKLSARTDELMVKELSLIHISGRICL